MSVAAGLVCRSRPWRCVGITAAALTTLLCLDGSAEPVPWRAAVANDGSEARVVARLVLHPEDDPGAGELRAGVLFEMDPGWHIYGREPGETGLPTELHWSVEGGRPGRIVWPAPETFREQEGRLTTYGYSGRVLLGVRVSFEGRRELSRTVGVDVDLLACRHECIPASFRLERAVGPQAVPSELPREALVSAFARAFADPTRGSAAGEAVAIEDEPRADGRLTWLQALGLALLGGLILNLMPCVLPVLAIKVCALAEMGNRTRRERLAHGLAYTSGVLLTMGILAGVILGMRIAGRAVGWGFQFQEPAFITAVSVVVLLFALNLLGVFEISVDAGRWAGVGSQGSALAQSFFEGLLAVLLATPCSAPFLGTAAGFAMAGSAGLVLAVFGCIGLGLAAPFLLVSGMPGWSRWIPRPGPWMGMLRTVLGFLLLAAVMWLVWIFGEVQGSDGIGWLLGFLWVSASLAWAYGLAQARRVAWLRVAASVGLVAVAVVGLDVVSLRAVPEGANRAETEGATWEPYDPVRVVEQVRGGAPAFVIFTAEWCLTCKVNERRVLAHERVRATMERLGVARFRADWTRRDESIRIELQRFGRAGVPMYLLYPAGSPEQVRVLPELLTVEGLIRDLGAAGAPGETRLRVSPITGSQSESPMQGDLPG